jgi:hypothetical protein
MCEKKQQLNHPFFALSNIFPVVVVVIYAANLKRVFDLCHKKEKKVTQRLA